MKYNGSNKDSELTVRVACVMANYYRTNFSNAKASVSVTKAGPVVRVTTTTDLGDGTAEQETFVLNSVPNDSELHAWIAAEEEQEVEV